MHKKINCCICLIMYINKLYGAELFFRDCPMGSYSRISQIFMELEDPLSCPCHEPDQSSSHHLIVSTKIHFNIICHLCLCVPSGIFPSILLTNILYPFRFSPFSCYMLFPSHPPWHDHSSYTLGKVQVTKLLIILLSFQMFSSAPCLLTPIIYTPPMSDTKFHTHTEPWTKL
jgi:hypothetical protein